MRKIEMTAEAWSRLLRLREGSAEGLDAADPVMALYGPIAMGPGPFVMAQVGQSLDGRVATPAGDARDISCPEGLAHLHRCRALVDAVMVGVGTVKADDPRLSVRLAKGPDPVRVVVDARATLTGEESLFHDGGAPVIVLQAEDAPRRSLAGEIFRLPRRNCGLDPRDMLEALGHRGLTRILVEGGARTISRFIDFSLIDRLHIGVAPLIIGAGPAGISLSPIDRLSAARRPQTEVYGLGRDILFDCAFSAPPVSGRQGQQIEVADHA